MSTASHLAEIKVFHEQAPHSNFLRCVFWGCRSFCSQLKKNKFTLLVLAPPLNACLSPALVRLNFTSGSIGYVRRAATSVFLTRPLPKHQNRSSLNEPDKNQNTPSKLSHMSRHTSVLWMGKILNTMLRHWILLWLRFSRNGVFRKVCLAPGKGRRGKEQNEDLQLCKISQLCFSATTPARFPWCWLH